MKKLKLHHLFLAFCFASASFLVESCTTAREREAESELQQFTGWVDRQSTQVANFSEEQWKELKQEYKQQTDRLDKTEDKLSREAKEQYRSAKSKFNEWDRELEQRFDDDRRRREQQAQSVSEEDMELELFADIPDVTAIPAQNMRDAYISFMQQVRRKKNNWGDAEWNQAEAALKKLNRRKDQVEKQLTTKDKSKITALQMEFQSLQTGSDLKDVYKNEIKDTYKDIKD